MVQHIWTICAGLLPTITALLAYLKSKETAKKTDIIIVQTNGTLTRLYSRNSQLAAELTKNDVAIPPPIEKRETHEGNS